MKDADTKRMSIIDTSAVPEAIRETLAVHAFDGVRKFFEDPDHAAGFRQWLAERNSHAPNE